MTEEIINLRNLIQNKGDIFYCEVDKCNVVKSLQQENEKLKEGYNKRGELMKIAAIQRENYKQALEEIKEIVNGHASPSTCDYYGSYKNACEPCALRILEQVENKIQDKINECLNPS